ncbi:MAG: leucine-rich repeat protein [Paludibacteraceae bacterium]|nr:leucine-rich repeat protein [Paludibacteraceae bacterium]
MKKKLTAIGALFAICLSMLATDMVVKQKNGEDWKINVDDVEEVFFEENAIIPEDSTVVDASETFLLFKILSDSTAKVIIEKFNSKTSYLGHDSITIPEKVRIKGKVYTVTEIGESAFWGCSSLTNINIPESVTNIEKNAFAFCNSLTDIEIPEGVTSIGIWAFYGCSSLESINIPEGVTYIGEYAFHDCNRLEPKLLIYDKGTKCYGWVGNKKKCTKVVIPESVTSIGRAAFTECYNLTSISIPEGVTSIGANAFFNCESMSSIEIPKVITNIEESVFVSCSSLTSINIPEGVTSIGKGAFAYCI